jgi:hypothetical protein
LFNTAALKVKVNPIVDDYERKYSNPIFAWVCNDKKREFQNESRK